MNQDDLTKKTKIELLDVIAQLTGKPAPKTSSKKKEELISEILNFTVLKVPISILSNNSEEPKLDTKVIETLSDMTYVPMTILSNNEKKGIKSDKKEIQNTKETFSEDTIDVKSIQALGIIHSTYVEKLNKLFEKHNTELSKLTLKIKEKQEELDKINIIIKDKLDALKKL